MYFEQNQNRQLGERGNGERLEITMAVKSQGKALGVEEEVTEDQLKLQKNGITL